MTVSHGVTTVGWSSDVGQNNRCVRVIVGAGKSRSDGVNFDFNEEFVVRNSW